MALAVWGLYLAITDLEEMPPELVPAARAIGAAAKLLFPEHYDREASRRYQRTHPERGRIRQRQWRRENRAAIAAYKRERRALTATGRPE